VTKQELSIVNDLITNYFWKRGSMQLVVLKHLASNPGKKLHTKDRRMLNVILQKAKAQAREQVQVDARRNRNKKRQSRQLAAMRAG
jgi:hypothetical protein